MSTHCASSLRHFSPLAFSHDESFQFKRTKHQGRRITLAGGKLHVFDKDSKRRESQLDAQAFGLAILPQLGPNEGGSEVRKIQELFTTFRVFDIDTKRAREPSDTRAPTPLQPDARNLAAFLGFLRTRHERIFRDSRTCAPGDDTLRHQIRAAPRSAGFPPA